MAQQTDIMAPPKPISWGERLQRLKEDIKRAKEAERNFLMMPATSALSFMGADEIDKLDVQGLEMLHRRRRELRDNTSKAKAALAEWKSQTVAGVLGLKYPE